MRARLAFLFILAALTVVAVMDSVTGGLNKLDRIGPVVIEPGNSHMNSGLSVDSGTPHVTKSGSLTMSAAGVTKFGITNDFGSVVITAGAEGAAGAEDSIEVDYDITVYAESDERAKEFANRCSVSLGGSGGEARAALSQPGESSERIMGVVTNYRVKLPPRLKVDVGNSFGEVSVEGVLGDVDIQSQYGATRTSNLGGSLVARIGFATAQISRVAKDADIMVQQGSLTLNGVGGNLTMRARLSRVDASAIAGAVDLIAEHGQVSLADVGGGLAGKGSFCPVNGRNVRGSVHLTSDHGLVEISGIDDETQVRSTYAPVRVELGEAAEGYRVEMRTRFGSIDADMPVTTGGRIQNEEQATAVVGRGGIPVRVESEFGTITLRTR